MSPTVSPTAFHDGVVTAAPTAIIDFVTLSPFDGDEPEPSPPTPLVPSPPPVPEPEPTPEQTPEPTPEQMPEPTPEPTPEPMPEPTPEPTSTTEGDGGIDGSPSPPPTGFDITPEPTESPLFVPPGLNMTDAPTAAPSTAPTDLGAVDMPSTNEEGGGEGGPTSGGKRSVELGYFSATTTALAVALAAGVRRV